MFQMFFFLSFQEAESSRFFPRKLTSKLQKSTKQQKITFGGVRRYVFFPAAFFRSNNVPGRLPEREKVPRVL